MNLYWSDLLLLAPAMFVLCFGFWWGFVTGRRVERERFNHWINKRREWARTIEGEHRQHSRVSYRTPPSQRKPVR